MKNLDLSSICSQFFYNLPKPDYLAQDFAVYNEVLDPLRDGLQNGWCNGSGFVVRRKAVIEIGGWPTDSVCEDAMCANKLIAAGWKRVLVNEELQAGLCPDTLESCIKQQMRWVFVLSLVAFRLILTSRCRLLETCKWLEPSIILH
jgi:cellulose synthase/poly-beta-1,6-N-acetylglucosamine synthase-like glycosyltransferase